MESTLKNSGETPVRAQPHGGSLLSGNPGNKGGGRLKNEWKEICQNLAAGEDTLAIAQAILKDKDHPAWLGAWKFVSEQGYGKPTADANVNLAMKTYMVVREGEDWTEGV